MNDIDKFIRTVDLANSPRRLEALKSLIAGVLYQWKEPVTIEELIELIKTEFNISLMQIEIETFLNSSDNEIIVQDLNRYFLTQQARYEIGKKELEQKGKHEERFNRWKSLVQELDNEINDESATLLTNLYFEYIYDCFIEYDKKALQLLIPEEFFKEQQNNKVNGDNVLNGILCKIQIPSLIKTFKLMINELPNKITSSDLEYLETLSIKTDCFLSLGNSEELFNKIRPNEINGLILFADTNFLFSILKLHKHIEEKSCLEILKLISNKQFNARIVYTQKTIEELNNFKNEWNNNISHDQYNNKYIKILIESGRLDEYAKSYYEEKLINPETAHPSDRVKYAIQTLKTKGIERYGNNFSNIDIESPYFNDCFESYREYERLVNEAKIERGFDEKIKTPDQVYHDVFLRESVKSLRENNTGTFSESKYFVLTLDGMLLKFDVYEGRKKIRNYTPIFMFPSYLLSRISCYLPLSTDDYKKAFILAVTSKFFGQDSKNSIVTQRSVGYFKSLGITDERTIIELITSDLFISKISNFNNSDEAKLFVSSEVNKKLEEKEKIIKSLESNLEESKTKTKNENLQLIDILKSNLDRKEDEILVLKNSYELQIAKLTEQNIELSNKLNTISHENNENRTVIERLSSNIELLSEQLKEESIKRNYENELINYNNNKNKFIENEWTLEKKSISIAFWHFISMVIIGVLALFIKLISDENLPKFILSYIKPYAGWWFLGLSLISLFFIILERILNKHTTFIHFIKIYKYL